MDASCHIIAFVSHWSSGAPSVGWLREFTVPGILQVAAVHRKVWGWVFRLPLVLELCPWLQSALFFPPGTHAHMQRH